MYMNTHTDVYIYILMHKHVFGVFLKTLVAPARSTRNVPLQQAVSQRKGFWYDQHIWMHLLEA